MVVLENLRMKQVEEHEMELFVNRKESTSFLGNRGNCTRD